MSSASIGAPVRIGPFDERRVAAPSVGRLRPMPKRPSTIERRAVGPAGASTVEPPVPR